MMVIPKFGIHVMLLLNTFPAVIFVNKSFKLVVVRSEFCVKYQTCPEFYDECTHQSSAFVHIPTESYEIFSPVLPAVQTVRQNAGNEIVERLNIRMPHEVNAKVVRNIFMTMLTKIQHFCMRYRELQKFR
jgi:hypothetical protein